MILLLGEGKAGAPAFAHKDSSRMELSIETPALPLKHIT
jgi:hypothetical protein